MINTTNFATDETLVSAVMLKVSTLIEKRTGDEPCAEAEADLLHFLRTRLAAPQAVQAAVPEAIEQMAADRYKVVPSHESMFHRWAVVADNGAQQLYIGRDGECQNMARKFMGAFLDGAFAAMQNAAPAHPAEGVPAQTTRDAVIQHLTNAGVLEHDGCGIFIASGDASELIDACMALSTHAHHEKGAAAQAVALLATGGQAQAVKPYKDSALQLHVGDSSFEGWYAGYVKHGAKGLKQHCRDAYAAGMGDPLVVAATHPTQQGLDAQELLAALGDLSFACFGGIGTKAPDAATYNRTFAVLQKHRDAAQAKQGGV